MAKFLPWDPNTLRQNESGEIEWQKDRASSRIQSDLLPLSRPRIEPKLRHHSLPPPTACCSRRRSSAAPTARLLRASSAGRRLRSSAAPPLVRDRNPPPRSTPSEHRRSAATVDRRRLLRPPPPRPSAAALLRDRDPPPRSTPSEPRRSAATVDRRRRLRPPPPHPSATATLHRVLPRRSPADPPPPSTGAADCDLRRRVPPPPRSSATATLHRVPPRRSPADPTAPSTAAADYDLGRRAPPRPRPSAPQRRALRVVVASAADLALRHQRLKTVYDEKVVPLITEEFGYANVHQVLDPTLHRHFSPRNLADETECYNMFRMTPPMFYRLHDLLVQSYGLKSTSKCNSIEALGMFLWMVGACQSVRQADNRLKRSLDTVHRNFEKVLKCLVKLAADIIRPLDPEFKTIHRRLQCPRFRPHFNDCIGAIDGTHVEVVVPNDKMVQYLCQKGITTQNVLAVVDFDMRFTFVLARWPGSVHDMRVFNDATNKYKAREVLPSRFRISKSCRVSCTLKYHLPEFRNSTMPRGMKENFNFAHSSLRNVVERAFGVLKMKWKMLLKVPVYPPAKQARIIVACIALHNFIRESKLMDVDFARCDRDEHYVLIEASLSQPRRRDTRRLKEDRNMNAFRDQLANALYNR
ncbi:hypothetical protein U9M48_029892 [Paspalum notatum var. saurae]|uniref:DDE Tnp4 domain-containing protein n=1 Tax=Paspalum notatum var. saurae TaxID=547442 RepID=A0AAQ3X1L3_PASNO